MKQKTFCMIKPLSFDKASEIFGVIEKAGFFVVDKKIVLMTKEQAFEFYHEHREKPFFAEIMNSIISGPVIMAVLEKHNAVVDFRKLLGHTNPAVAENGTIRKVFGKSITHNASHGSDSLASSKREREFFKKLSEI